VNDVARERANSFLKPEHQSRILAAYKAFADDPGFAKVVATGEILEKDGNLSIPRYVRPAGNGNGNGGGDGPDLKETWKAFETSGREFWEQMDELVDMLDGVVAGGGDRCLKS
jgi:type I restriction enzyme M protein